MDITVILSKRYPDAEWTLDGDNYNGLTWLSDTPKPSKKTLEGLWVEVQAEIASERQAREDARQSAIGKLEALGLTVDEVSAAFGIEV